MNFADLSNISLTHCMCWSQNFYKEVYVSIYLSLFLSELFTIALRWYVNMEFLVYRGLWHSCFVLKEENGVTTATAIPPSTEAAPIYVALIKVYQTDF